MYKRASRGVHSSFYHFFRFSSRDGWTELRGRVRPSIRRVRNQDFSLPTMKLYLVVQYMSSCLFYQIVSYFCHNAYVLLYHREIKYLPKNEFISFIEYLV